MDKMKLDFGNGGRICLIVSLLAIGCNGVITSAFAVGMGAAKVESFIGEMLDISIPIVNIEGTDNLTLELDQNSVSLLGGSPLVVELENRDDQLFARIRSDFLVNEPYLSFSLNLSDDKSRSAKQFTVLLDLAPTEKAVKNAEAAKRAVVGSSITTVKSSRTGQRAGKSVAQYNTQSGRSTRRSNATLSSGSKLVEPGETLWGIARKASQGTSVSINQMMVAIYQNNSSAFAKGSIDLLKAGSSIDIPDFESATQISSGRATQRVLELSGQRTESRGASVALASPDESLGSLPAEGSLSAEGSLPADGSSSSEDEIIDEMFSAEDLEEQLADEIDDDLVRNDGVQSDAFKLTGIAVAADGSSIGLRSSSDPQAQEVIDSLAATVGNLTQDIIAKEKQVQFLEDRIQALESFQAQEEVQANSVASSVVASGGESEKSKLWWLLPLGILALLALLFRDWIGARFQSSSEDDDYFEGYDAELPNAKAEPPAVSGNERDYSVLSSRHGAPNAPVDDGVEGVSFIEIETNEFDEKLNLDVGLEVPAELSEELFPDESEPAKAEDLEELESEHTLEFTFSGEAESDDIYDLSESGDELTADFDDRLDRLIEEQDYDFARDLLDSARNNEISDGRYHFEQLRLFFAMDDEDGFQKYYDKIRPNLEKFDEDVIAGIEGLVSSIKQQS